MRPVSNRGIDMKSLKLLLRFLTVGGLVLLLLIPLLMIRGVIQDRERYRAMAEVRHALSCSAVGSADTVRRQMTALIAQYRPDEVMLTGMIHDHAARLHSFTLGAQAMRQLMSPVAHCRTKAPLSCVRAHATARQVLGNSQRLHALRRLWPGP